MNRSRIAGAGAQAQIHLTVIRARAALVGTRTALVNAARGLTKSYGERLSKSGTGQMSRAIAQGLSQELRDALDPLLGEIESLNGRIAEGGLNGSTQRSPEVLSAGISMTKFVRKR
jgi:transposase